MACVFIIGRRSNTFRWAQKKKLPTPNIKDTGWMHTNMSNKCGPTDLLLLLSVVAGARAFAKVSVCRSKKRGRTLPVATLYSYVGPIVRFDSDDVHVQRETKNK